jgi:hypothetical protein
VTRPPAEPGAAVGAHGYSADNASVGQLVGQVAQDMSVLMRQELELAKAETQREVVKAGKASAMLAVAGFAGYMVLLFASIALWWGLSNVMDQGWAALIVTGIWAVIGAVLFMLGRERFKQVNPKPEQTVETVREIPDSLKGARS